MKIKIVRDPHMLWYRSLVGKIIDVDNEVNSTYAHGPSYKAKPPYFGGVLLTDCIIIKETNYPTLSTTYKE